MAVPATIARAATCYSCKQWMLRSFIASIGGPHALPASRSQPRAFSSRAPRRNEARERLQQEIKVEEHALNEINEWYTPEWQRRDQRDTEAASNEPLIERTEVSSPNEHVPWYLQVEPQTHPQENVISARQRIPDLPEHPPAILQPLLDRISIELGMDDLSVLDLRGIDPPPALGANLLMIVGTARSEKHLHFSADKLCRWLRTEFKLTPYADGLLGRQELKLKMRRRAKRSRLLSAVGAKSTADTELEDGIRTGWICVNLGRVEGGELPQTKDQIEREHNIIGFGTVTRGSNIVVQLLTEEKRGEIDLEKLWTGILTRSRKEKEALEEASQTILSDIEGDSQQPGLSTPAGQADHAPIGDESKLSHSQTYYTPAG